MRTRTNCGSSRHSSIWRTWPTGTPENCTCDPLLSPSTDCLKKMSYSRFAPPLSFAIQTTKIAIARVKKSTKAPTSTLRSEEHTSELQSLMRISYAVFCLKKQKTQLQPNELETTT